MQMLTSIKAISEPLAIGPHVVPNRVFLAPMSGVSDRPFRQLASSFGAGLVVSEMVASELLARGNPEALMRAEHTGRGLHVIQLAGREARWMAEGARVAVDAGADLIDINMGCPAKRVTGGYSGSALMRDLDHALTLIDATVAASAVPVTLKIRLGWDHASVNAPELAARAERAGVGMITVHGRTRCQFYSGTADWAAIRAVKNAVSVPVVANGDLCSAMDLGRMLSLSGADAVMIGRGTYGRPWFAGHIAAYAAGGLVPEGPNGRRLFELVEAHYDAILGHYGLAVGLKAARKHLGWYLRCAGAPDGLRAAAQASTDPSDVRRLLSAALIDSPAKCAA
jgi:tRNA-dihydrouridine synthase B